MLTAVQEVSRITAKGKRSSKHFLHQEDMRNTCGGSKSYETFRLGHTVPYARLTNLDVVSEIGVYLVDLGRGESRFVERLDRVRSNKKRILPDSVGANANEQHN